MTLKLENELSVAWPPEVLIFLKLVVTSPAAVLLVSAVKHGASEVDQHKDWEFARNVLIKCFDGCLILWMRSKKRFKLDFAALKITITCE